MAEVVKCNSSQIFQFLQANCLGSQLDDNFLSKATFACWRSIKSIFGFLGSQHMGIGGSKIWLRHRILQQASTLSASVLDNRSQQRSGASLDNRDTKSVVECHINCPSNRMARRLLLSTLSGPQERRYTPSNNKLEAIEHSRPRDKVQNGESEVSHKICSTGRLVGFDRLQKTSTNAYQSVLHIGSISGLPLWEWFIRGMSYLSA